MPILTNQRHELFAQALAAGKTADEAYQEAGFSANRGNATRLKAKESVAARVAELQSRVSAGLVITKQWVIERLVENANRAMQAEQPEEGADYRYEGSVANRALELLGKELGMFIERKDIRLQSLSELTADEIDTFLAELGAEEARGSDNGTAH